MLHAGPDDQRRRREGGGVDDEAATRREGGHDRAAGQEADDLHEPPADRVEAVGHHVALAAHDVRQDRRPGGSERRRQHRGQEEHGDQRAGWQPRDGEQADQEAGDIAGDQYVPPGKRSA
jgi:hypothetical protein